MLEAEFRNPRSDYMADKMVVLTTCGSVEEARMIANTLVERRLAACVNIIPRIESVYRWKDKVETATEPARDQEYEEGFRRPSQCNRRIALLRAS
jgi:hypothetical protein